MRRVASALASALFCCASVAHAQPVDSSGVLDQALRTYRTAAEGWQNAAVGAATSLFWSLATISLVWTMGQLVLRRAELGEVFGELVRFLLFTGFWAWMLANGPTHARMIMDSMVQLAGDASAQNPLSPSGVLDVGFHVLDRALTQSSIMQPLDSAIGIFLALGILVVLALVGVNMLVTQIASWIIAYGGLIVLGFGGSRWTSDMATNYYRMVLSLGLQVLAMVLLVGIGESFLRGYYDALGKDISLHQQAVLLVVAIVLLATVNRVPSLLGSLANGSSPQYALGGGAGAAAAWSTLSAGGGAAALAAGVPAAGAVSLLAKATGAATDGARSATGALVEAFRSRAGEASGASAGSVFAATDTGKGGGGLRQDGPPGETSAAPPRSNAEANDSPSATTAQDGRAPRSAEATLRQAAERGETTTDEAESVGDELRAARDDAGPKPESHTRDDGTPRGAAAVPSASSTHSHPATGSKDAGRGHDGAEHGSSRNSQPATSVERSAATARPSDATHATTNTPTGTTGASSAVQQPTRAPSETAATPAASAAAPRPGVPAANAGLAGAAAAAVMAPHAASGIAFTLPVTSEAATTTAPSTTDPEFREASRSCAQRA